MKIVKLSNNSDYEVGFNYNGVAYVVPKKGSIQVSDFIGKHAVKVSYQLNGENPLSIEGEEVEEPAIPGYTGPQEKRKVGRPPKNK